MGHNTQIKSGTFHSPFFCGPRPKKRVKHKEGTPDELRDLPVASLPKDLLYDKVNEVPQIEISIYKNNNIDSL